MKHTMHYYDQLLLPAHFVIWTPEEREVSRAIEAKSKVGIARRLGVHGRAWRRVRDKDERTEV